MKHMRIAMAALYILFACLAPWAMADEISASDAPETSQPTQPVTLEATQPTNAAAEATQPTTQAPIPPATEGTTEPTTEPTTEATESPTEHDSADTSEPDSDPASEPVSDPTSEPASSGTTEPTSEPASGDMPGSDVTPVPEVTPGLTPEPTIEPTPGATVVPQEVSGWLKRLAPHRTYADYLAALKEQLNAYQQSALLPELVSRLESGRYTQFENNVEESLQSEIARRLKDGSISEANILAYYKARRETDILTFISELTVGSIELGNISWGSNSLKTGDTIMLAVPIVFTPASGQNNLYSNVSGGSYVRHAKQFNTYDSDLCGYLSYVRVDLETGADSFPFETPNVASYTLLGKVADNYSQWGLTYDEETGLYSGLSGDTVLNGGFALFKLKVDSDLYTGSYPVNFTIHWTNAQTGRSTATAVSTSIYIKGKTQYTGGGYYGGGGGGSASPTLAPSTKLYVESISTDPENVSAGDTFDLVITIRNTSEKRYVQNMKVTVTAADDALLPVSGSSTVYVSRIDADSVYELRMPVKAKLDMPDEPLKIDISLEYEDSEVTSLSANQTLVMQVAQVHRLAVSEPSLPTDIPEAGDTYPVTIQLVNEGRTTLYNVTVTASSDNEQLLSPLPYYVGNLEGGSSHKAEIDLVPLMEGMYDVTFDITYENAQGEIFSMDPQYGTFYAQAVEEYDYSEYNYEDFTETAVEDTSAMDILRKMPWWLYGAVGALVVCLISLGAASAHARRRKALEEDEME